MISDQKKDQSEGSCQIPLASCPLGIRHESEIIDIVRRTDLLERAVLEIRDKLLGRPSWIVMMAMSFLFAVCSSMTVWILTHK
jgi:hypothetical protein